VGNLGHTLLLAKKQIANCINLERYVEASLEQGINREMLNSHQSVFISLPYEDTTHHFTILHQKIFGYDTQHS
jgi:hypothetical protein